MMMERPRLLDLFCGAGGAAFGYDLAGFDVVGVDIMPQPHYPFEFHQADALEYLRAHGRDFDVVHASPPCQAYSRMATITKTRDRYEQLIDELRPSLISTGRPYVIENVMGAPLLDPIKLCGTMFGLGIIRHRLFEIRPPIYFLPATCNHHSHTRPIGRKNMTMGYYNNGAFPLMTIAGHTFSRKVGSRAMGIDWMTRDELAEAVPPAYTAWIGSQLMPLVREK